MCERERERERERAIAIESVLYVQLISPIATLCICVPSLLSSSQYESILQTGVHGKDRASVGLGYHTGEGVAFPHVHITADRPSESDVILYACTLVQYYVCVHVNMHVHACSLNTPPPGQYMHTGTKAGTLN